MHTSHGNHRINGVLVSAACCFCWTNTHPPLNMGKKEVRELYIDKCIPLWNDIQHLHMSNQYTHRERDNYRHTVQHPLETWRCIRARHCSRCCHIRVQKLVASLALQSIVSFLHTTHHRLLVVCGCVGVHINVCECSIVCDIEFSCKLNQLKHAFVFQLVGWIFMRTFFQLKFHFEFRISNLVNRHR